MSAPLNTIFQMSAPFERKEGPPFEGGAHSSIDALSSKYGKYGKYFNSRLLVIYLCIHGKWLP